MNIPSICDIQPLGQLSMMTDVIENLSHPLITDWCTIHQPFRIVEITMRISLTLVLGSCMRFIIDNT